MNKAFNQPQEKMDDYEKMQACYEANKGKRVVTSQYEAEVCGFHFRWDDGDANSIIVAITKVKCLHPGIRYMLNGDVYVTHKQNPQGYQFINTMDLEDLGLTKPG